MEYDIGSKIKAARLKKKMTQEQVAELLGVSRQTISNWENEKSYLLIWAVAMIVFWFFTSGSDAMGYSLMFLWIILPITTFVVSIIIGKNDFWGKGKWAITLFFGVMYMLAEYGTFKMANNITFDKLNAPAWGMVVAGTIISTIGMLVGSLFNKQMNK